MGLFSDLDARGLVHASTDRDSLARRMDDGPIGVYYGCDPSADSLHHGNLIGLVMLRRFQDAGHRAVALAGGATGMIGDPGGRSEERNLLDEDTLRSNVTAIKRQITQVLGEGGEWKLVDNLDWTRDLPLLAFLRDIGKHVTINQMVARESVKARMASEHGISYTEFTYMLLQAQDYLWLHDHEGCDLQIGGSDQWGNIISGVDLIHRSRGHHAHALAWPLLLAPDGSKIGKTTGARIWLDADKTSPYQFHQHWVNLSDAEVDQQLPMFSLRPLDEVNTLLDEHHGAPERRAAQRALADELTALVHGSDAADAARGAADVLFGGDPLEASELVLSTLAREIPSSKLASEALADPVDLLVATELAGSKSEARRLLAQGSIKVNGVPVTADTDVAEATRLHGRWLLLRKGRRSHHLAEVFPTAG